MKRRRQLLGVAAISSGGHFRFENGQDHGMSNEHRQGHNACPYIPTHRHLRRYPKGRRRIIPSVTILCVLLSLNVLDMPSSLGYGAVDAFLCPVSSMRPTTPRRLLPTLSRGTKRGSWSSFGSIQESWFHLHSSKDEGVDYFWDDDEEFQDETERIFSKRTMDTSLCIVPPDHLWDEIQRARHLARDPTFFRWPPAIRLFHPFLPRSLLPDAATSLADFIDRYRLEPFEITLSTLTIVPHQEALEEIEDRTDELPEQEKNAKAGQDGDEDGFLYKEGMTDEEKKVEQSIIAEVKKGKERKKRRLANKMRKQKMAMEENKENDENTQKLNEKTSNSSQEEPGTVKPSDDGKTGKRRRGRRSLTENELLSPQQRVQRQMDQQRMFNGPCIICLEPDDESKIKLLAFREVLRKKLFSDYDPFSPSSTLSPPPSNNAGLGPSVGCSTGSGTTAAASSSPTERKINNCDYCGLPRSVLQEHGIIPSKEGENKGGPKARRSQKEAKRIRKKMEGATFRPVLTLGKFSTVTSAVKVAKQVKRMWEPLTFKVTDLHLVSRMEPDDSSFTELMEDGDGSDRYATTSNLKTSESGEVILPENREYELRKIHGTTEESTHEGLLMAKGEYGCDAVVKLAGEEWQLTKYGGRPTGPGLDLTSDGSGNNVATDDNQQVVDMIMGEAGNPGGGQLSDANLSSGDNNFSSHGTAKEGLVEDNFISTDMEELLGDDEDWDEGATIVIGRTQYYMGEMRQYIGMPASSTMDGKDRILGDGVSATLRRRGTVHRQANRWDDGDFGVKEKDKRVK